MSKKKIVCTLVSVLLSVLAAVLGCVFGIDVDFEGVLPSSDDAYVSDASSEAHGQN